MQKKLKHHNSGNSPKSLKNKLTAYRLNKHQKISKNKYTQSMQNPEFAGREKYSSNRGHTTVEKAIKEGKGYYSPYETNIGSVGRQDLANIF